MSTTLPLPAQTRTAVLPASTRAARALALVVGVGLVARFALLPLFADVGPQTVDAREYSALAVNIVERGEFAVKPGQPTSARPPLYPAMVAAVYAVVGPGSLQAVRFVQVLLAALTTVVVYRLGRELYDHRVGLAAAVIATAYPTLWGYCYLVLTEVLFTLLMCLGVLFVVRFFRRDRLADLAVGAVVLGLAALTRSAMVLYPIPLLVLLACAGRMSPARRLAAAAVFLGAFAATLAPWAVRNTLLEGTPTLVDSQGGRVLRWSLDPKRVEAVAGPTTVAETATQGERDRKALAESATFARERPAAVVEHVAVNFFRFWRLDRELVALAGEGSLPSAAVLLLAVVVCAYYALTLLVGIAGGMLCPPRDRLAAAAAWSVVAVICLVHALVYGHSRYHVVVMPVIAIAAAALLVHYRAAASGRVRRGIVALACAVFVAAWVVQVVQDDLGPLLHVLSRS